MDGSSQHFPFLFLPLSAIMLPLSCMDSISDTQARFTEPCLVFSTFHASLSGEALLMDVHQPALPCQHSITNSQIAKRPMGAPRPSTPLYCRPAQLPCSRACSCQSAYGLVGMYVPKWTWLRLLHAASCPMNGVLHLPP